jgi:hypothetical protein
MHVPRHEELGIVLQDEDFLERKRWDFAATPADRYPLLLHHHPLELYRHQVIKQTDVVLATSSRRMRFRVQVRGQVVSVDLTHETTTYRLVAGRGPDDPPRRRGAPARARRRGAPARARGPGGETGAGVPMAA